MSFLRSSLLLKALAARHSAQRLIPSSINRQQRLYAQQSYGGGEGDPKGEDPQNQGSNPSAELEHPGPPPPSVGQGTGGGPTKAGEKGHNTLQNDSSSGSSSESGSGSSKGSKASNGAQPKLYSAAPPAEPSEDVKKHNKEFDNRHGREQKNQDEDGKDDVGKGFWSGHGGADRNP
ncbi:hypothetical protein MMC24_001094 [Lignoscripta atroalba]|nr:hypothetical protein [Lignoscripta atroalba]